MYIPLMFGNAKKDINSDVSTVTDTYETITNVTGKGFLSNISYETANPTTKLLAHFDGADADNYCYSEIPNRQIASFFGTAQIDTAQYKFGTSSLLLDGNSDYITFSDSDNYSFGAGDFTIDMWVRLAVEIPAESSYSLYYQSTGSPTNTVWLRLQRITDGTYWLSFSVYSAGSSILSMSPVTSAFAINTWYHIAVVRSGSNVTLYRDGNIVETKSGGGIFPNIASTLKIGAASGNYFNGWIDELRVVKGEAMWATTFTPPVAAYNYTKNCIFKITVDSGTPIEIQSNTNNIPLVYMTNGAYGSDISTFIPFKTSLKVEAKNNTDTTPVSVTTTYTL
jgi:hypothetical protein